MLLSILTRNDEVPRLNFSPVRSRSWLKSSVDGSFRTRTLDPAQMSSLREPGAQDLSPSAAQATQMAGGQVPQVTF